MVKAVKEDTAPAAGRDLVAECLSGKCEVAAGINDAEQRYESASKDVIVALQTRFGVQAVKALRGSKLSVGEIAKKLEADRLAAEQKGK